MNVFDEDMIEDYERRVAECLTRKPSECTRCHIDGRDGCGCKWCKEFDGLMREKTDVKGT